MNIFVENLNNVLSLIAIIISIFSLKRSAKVEKIGEASKLVCKVMYNKTDDRINKQREIYGKDFLPVIIENNSSGEFRDVIVIAVENIHGNYITVSKFFQKLKSIDGLRPSIKSGYYKYIRSIIGREEIFVETGGKGMYKMNGVILVFKDGYGNEWIKDVDNHIYKADNIINELIKIGLPCPGFENNGI